MEEIVSVTKYLNAPTKVVHRIYDPDWWRALPEEEQGPALVQRIIERRNYRRSVNMLLYGEEVPSAATLAQAALWDYYSTITVNHSRGFGKTAMAKMLESVEQERRESMAHLEGVAVRGLKAYRSGHPLAPVGVVRWPGYREPQRFEPEWAWPAAFGPFAEQGGDFMSTLLRLKHAIEERNPGREI